MPAFVRIAPSHCYLLNIISIGDEGWVAGWLGGWVAGWLGGWVAGARRAESGKV